MSDVLTKPRNDFEQLRRARSEYRLLDRLEAHYLIEKSLAIELKASQRSERASLCGALYERLFEAVPDHPQRTGRIAIRDKLIVAQVALLKPFLSKHATYVEIGCGDALLTKGIASRVRAAIGVDVTSSLVTDDEEPGFEFALSDGIHLPLPNNSADLVYSNQLMEHLHPDDVLPQLNEIYRILKVGGRYICATPSRLTGPHDISAYFGYEPTGFHMREYDYRSLSAIFRAVGFTRLKALTVVKGRRLLVPVYLAGVAEQVVEAMPGAIRVKLATSSSAIVLAGVTLVGRK